MSDTQTRAIVMLLTSWLAVWLTEVLVVRAKNNEEVPFWFYGLQSFALVTAVYQAFK